MYGTRTSSGFGDLSIGGIDYSHDQSSLSIDREAANGEMAVELDLDDPEAFDVHHTEEIVNNYMMTEVISEDEVVHVRYQDWMLEENILFYTVDEIMNLLRVHEASVGLVSTKFHLSRKDDVRKFQLQNLCSRIETLMDEFEAGHFSFMVLALTKMFKSEKEIPHKLLRAMITQTLHLYDGGKMSLGQMVDFSHEVYQTGLYSPELSRFILDTQNDLLLSVDDRDVTVLAQQYKLGHNYPKEVLEMLALRLLSTSKGVLDGPNLAILSMSVQQWGAVGQKLLVGLAPRVLDAAPSMEAQDVANVLFAYSRLGVFQADLYSALTDRLELVADGLEVRHIAQVSEALQYFKMYPDDLLLRIAECAVSILQTGKHSPVDIVQLMRYTANLGCFDGNGDLFLPFVRYMERSITYMKKTDVVKFVQAYGALQARDVSLYSENLMRKLTISMVKSTRMDAKLCSGFVYGVGLMAPTHKYEYDVLRNVIREMMLRFVVHRAVDTLNTVPLCQLSSAFGNFNFPFRNMNLHNGGMEILDNIHTKFSTSFLRNSSASNLTLFLEGFAKYGYKGSLDDVTVLERIGRFNTEKSKCKTHDVDNSSTNTVQNVTFVDDMFLLKHGDAVSLLCSIGRLNMLDVVQTDQDYNLKVARKAVAVLLEAIECGHENMSIADVALFAEAVGMLEVNHPDLVPAPTQYAWNSLVMPTLRAVSEKEKNITMRERRELWVGYLSLRQLHESTATSIMQEDNSSDLVDFLNQGLAMTTPAEMGLGWTDGNANIQQTFADLIHQTANALDKRVTGDIRVLVEPHVHMTTGYMINAMLVIESDSETSHSNEPVRLGFLLQPESAYLQVREDYHDGQTRVEMNGTASLRKRLLEGNGLNVITLRLSDFDFLSPEESVDYVVELVMDTLPPV
eukprot:CFRG2510T1